MNLPIQHEGKISNFHRDAAGIRPWANVFPYVNGELFGKPGSADVLVGLVNEKANEKAASVGPLTAHSQANEDVSVSSELDHLCNALRVDWFSVCPPTGTGVKLRGDDLFSTPRDQSEIDFQNEGGETYICGNPLIASRLHWVWIGKVCVRMLTDFSYSNTLGWNTFLPTARTANRIRPDSYAPI